MHDGEGTLVPLDGDTDSWPFLWPAVPKHFLEKSYILG